MMISRFLPVVLLVVAVSLSSGCKRNTSVGTPEQDYAQRGQPTSDTPYTHMKDEGSTPKEQETSNQPDGKVPDSVHHDRAEQPDALNNKPGAKS